ncbi:hypothetical protein EDD15DRAFT_2390902 [Pisolithus albus]|nr:hypothetical protein EDD15DRAFT_2390902 [Pisolithus albus]
MPAKKPDYYAILGLTNDASDNEIRAAYKKLALQWHPDRHLSGKERAAQIFIEVNTAYHALMDGKESTHSSSPENSSATSCSNTGSSGTASSDHSSHPPSDSKKSSRTKSSRNEQRSSSEGRRRRPVKSECDHASRPENTTEDRSSRDRMKGRRHASKSQDHLRDSTKSGGRKSPFPSAFGFAARSQHSADSNADHQSEKHKPSSRFGLADDFIHRLSKGRQGGKDRQDFIPHVDDVPPLRSPLRAMGSPRGTSKEWMFPLPMTLEEIFYGSRQSFLIKRELLSRKIEEVEICVRVPAGTRAGTRIVCRGAGHQRKDGTFQDVVFLVEDEPGQRFSRVNDDLYLDVRVPWRDSLADHGGDVHIDGLDGEKIVFPLPYPIHDNTTEGQVFVVSRGDMIVRWQVVFTVPSKWEAFKRVFRVNP